MNVKDIINFDDWQKIDLRVGKINSVGSHPNADKLYVLTVDFGEELGERTIVAGLKEYCGPEHLEGKSAIFVVNLEPRAIRGVESQGMILAVVSPSKTKGCFLKPAESFAEPGSPVS